jgi:hypothetical protein
MRLLIKITCVLFLIFSLLTSCLAATENKDMPSEKEVNDFIDSFEAPKSGDFTNSAYDAFIEKYPAGHCDVWSNGMISFYYYDPDSPKEYGSIYLDSNGEKVKPGCGAGITWIKRYQGDNSQSFSDNSQSSGDNSQSSGDNSQSSSDNSQSSSDNSQSYGGNSQVSGDNSQSSSDNSQSYGGNSQVSGDNSQSSSDNSQSSSDNSQSSSDNSQSYGGNTSQHAKDEKTIWDNHIFSEIFIGVAVAFIAWLLHWN